MAIELLKYRVSLAGAAHSFDLRVQDGVKFTNVEVATYADGEFLTFIMAIDPERNVRRRRFYVLHAGEHVPSAFSLLGSTTVQTGQSIWHLYEVLDQRSALQKWWQGSDRR